MVVSLRTPSDVSPRRVTRMRQDRSSSTASPSTTKTQLVPPGPEPSCPGTHSPVPAGAARSSLGNQTRTRGASPDHSMTTGTSLSTRLPLELIPLQRRVRSGSASLQEAVIGGRRSASDGEGASEPGHASGTRRHLMGRTNMFVGLVSKSAIFRMTPRSRGAHAFIYLRF